MSFRCMACEYGMYVNVFGVIFVLAKTLSRSATPECVGVGTRTWSLGVSCVRMQRKLLEMRSSATVVVVNMVRDVYIPSAHNVRAGPVAAPPFAHVGSMQ